MSKLDRAITELTAIDSLAKRDRFVNRLHPLVKLILTIAYIVLVVSFGKYDLAGLLSMLLYPLFFFELGDVSFHDALYRLRFVLPVVCVVGIANPFFDHTVVGEIFGVPVWGGVLSMLTLMTKAVFAVLASYLLIATTPIESICYALRLLRLPKIFVVQILLIYRYLTVLLTEARRVTTAYRLRAPGQNGIARSAWGPLVGQLLLRSMDRADALYESMRLRGFRGEFYPANGTRLRAVDLWFFMLVLAALLLLRVFPVMAILGGLLL